ncbi:alkaline D-peptidase [Arcticibacter tournemirensis]|uniref:Beta-lactamase family protein n=1 Tax=Arcticibacter tournemirensis TaxID=699437 RepID=A0A5M9HCI6_9SPHI|nr:serine hydrolase domain-containing protein [Arcticibacter tournemirensis]KAA8484045.1 beta-lactamase family protein [Arcticibacter tournemirensis]TQM51778.1 alkaline D-peptidase [Arcticibacter tournemirensis]
MKFFYVALLLYAFSSSAYSQQRQSDISQELTRKLATYVDSMRLKHSGAGILVHVYKPGVIDWNYANGLADIDSLIPAKPDMHYRIASISKLFCATAVLKLASAGSLTLDDPISKWLPSKFISKIANGDKITIRNLLNHTSGIYELQGSEIDPLNDSTDYSMVLPELIAGMKQTAGYSNFFYSSSNYILLAEIIKKASKMSYGDYIRSAILEPFNLSHTYVATLPVKNRFKGYIPSLYLKKYADTVKVSLIDASDFNMSFHLGSADISSSTSDLIKFYYELHEGKIIPKNLVNEMFGETVASNRPSKRYGLGTMLFEHNGLTVVHGHIGQAAGYKNILAKNQLTNTYIAISFNLFHISDEILLETMFGLNDIMEE